jgi:pimeloyl-ACP methyl ester carboxylesterase
MFANMRRYGAAPVPILAILAMPKRCEPQCDTPATKRIMAGDAARAELFEKNAPNARVVRIAKASHFIWRSNEAQVEQEMNSFMDTLH